MALGIIEIDLQLGGMATDEDLTHTQVACHLCHSHGLQGTKRSKSPLDQAQHSMLPPLPHL